MDYKSIIKSRELRIKILTFLGWIPDGIMLRLQYWLQTGRKLNLKNPKRFTEKLQLYKMKYRNPEMLRCTDKYEVRKYVEQKGFGKYLIPLIGIYDSVDEIDFKGLPHKFVAKTTDGGGGNQVLVCTNKSLLSEKDFRLRLNKWMDARKASKHPSREWAYENDYPRRIIIEQFIGKEGVDKSLIDYKFFCFNGKVAYVYAITDRDLGDTVQLGVYSPAFRKLDVSRNDERPQNIPMEKPLNYKQMIRIAEELSTDFPHVRVDLYNIEGCIYFGELTFYDGSGYMTFNPDSFDLEFGKAFDCSTFMK